MGFNQYLAYALMSKQTNEICTVFFKIHQILFLSCVFLCSTHKIDKRILGKITFPHFNIQDVIL